MSDYDRCFYATGGQPCNLERVPHAEFAILHPFTGPPAGDVLSITLSICAECDNLRPHINGYCFMHNDPDAPLGDYLNRVRAALAPNISDNQPGPTASDAGLRAVLAELRAKSESINHGIPYLDEVADRLEAALNAPTAAVCDVKGMDCVHDMPERCAVHWIAEPDSQQGWADYTHRQGEFEAAGGKHGNG